MTHLYGVIGDPVTHSLSPLIHRGWMRDNHLDADYRGFQVPAGELQSGMAALERDGVRGLNVTLPHKSDVIALCGEKSPLVQTIGAANTLSRLPDGGWRADNTDKDGFLEDFQAAYAGELTNTRILMLGAGGAARAVALALTEAGADVAIANRTLERASQLCADLGLPENRAIPLTDYLQLVRSADAVVNCLSLGHSGEMIELGDGDGRLVYDISYGKAAAPFLEASAATGWKVADGLGMLVGQAALSFEIWHGLRPDKASALSRCRAALEAIS